MPEAAGITNELGPLTSWLYASRSAMTDEGPDTLGHLVATSRANNAALLVTGALIFTGTHFAQYIEGPPDSVARLRARISADPRHNSVHTFVERPVAARRFGAWSLAYAGEAKPFDQLVAFAHRLGGHAAEILLTEMFRSFLAQPFRQPIYANRGRESTERSEPHESAFRSDAAAELPLAAHRFQ